MSYSLTGIIAGGMAGGAEAVQGIAQQDIKHSQQVDLMKETQAAEQAKQVAIDQARRDGVKADRTAMATEINTRSGVIADQMRVDGLKKFYQKNGDGSVDVDAITPATLNDDQKRDAPITDDMRAKARIRALTESGYADPAHELAYDSRQASLEARQDILGKQLTSREGIEARKEAGRDSRQDDRLDSEEERAAARLSAAGGGKGASKDRLTTIVNSSNQTIKNLTESDRPKTPEGKAAWQRQLDDAISLRDAAMGQLKNGLVSSPAAATAPAGATGPAPAKVGSSVSTAPKGVADAAAAARAKFFGN